jgi:hypothetical protein
MTTMAQLNKQAGRLRSDAIDEELHGRLLNWGRWLRYDDTVSQLGYPKKCPFTFSPSRGGMVADIDAQHIEHVVSSLDMAGRGGFGHGWMYAFILRVEYAEKPDGLMGPVSERAKDVSRRFKTRCSQRQYYNLLYRARRMVAEFVDKL